MQHQPAITTNPGLPQLPSDGFKKKLILSAVRRKWKIALPISLVLAGITAALVIFTFKPVYRTSFWLSFDYSTPYVVMEKKSSEVEVRRFIATQMELLRSPMVLSQAISQPEIASLDVIKKKPDPVVWLAQEIDMRQKGASNLFEVVLEGPDPSASQAIVNAVTNAYLEYRSSYEDENRRRVAGWLHKEKERYFSEIKSLRKKLETLAQQLTGGDPFASLDSNPEGKRQYLSSLLSRIVDSEISELGIRQEIEALNSPDSATDISASEAFWIQQILEVHPALSALDQSIEATEEAILRFEANARHPERLTIYKELKASLAKQTKNRDEMKRQVAESAQNRLTLEEDLDEEQLSERLKRDADKLAAQRARLKELAEEEMSRVNRGNTDMLQLEFVRAELKVAEETHDSISYRITQLEVESSGSDQVQPLREAILADTPLRAFPLEELALGGMGSFALPIGLLVIFEVMARRVSDSDSLEQDVELSVLGEVTRLPAANSAGMVSTRGQGELRVFEESFHALATTLRIGSEFQGIRVLTVTSAAMHEGKTSVATQLAVSLARATNQKTLLIDGDMRSPDVHEYFETRLTPGLADVLNGQCNLEEATTPAEGHVDVIPAGILNTSPHDLLGESSARKLIDELLTTYDRIIIDTPPILSASETLVLAQAADATLFCAMRDVSRLQQIKTANERLRLAGVNTIGVVLSGVPSRAYIQKYGSYDTEAPEEAATLAS